MAEGAEPGSDRDETEAGIGIENAYVITLIRNPDLRMRNVDFRVLMQHINQPVDL